uniref:Uncharacterized protein n=1 Tax=Daucus carota subsp. sativus TaxID=79200 RepID=A0A162B4M1_DAUCS
MIPTHLRDAKPDYISFSMHIIYKRTSVDNLYAVNLIGITSTLFHIFIINYKPRNIILITSPTPRYIE